MRRDITLTNLTTYHHSPASPAMPVRAHTCGGRHMAPPCTSRPRDAAWLCTNHGSTPRQQTGHDRMIRVPHRRRRTGAGRDGLADSRPPRGPRPPPLRPLLARRRAPRNHGRAWWPATSHCPPLEEPPPGTRVRSRQRGVPWAGGPRAACGPAPVGAGDRRSRRAAGGPKESKGSKEGLETP